MPHKIAYKTRKTITMDPNFSETTHVMVQDGRILVVGNAEHAVGWTDAQPITDLPTQC